MSTILNTVYDIHLADLFGPDATITDVVYEGGVCSFSIPLDAPQAWAIPVTCTISGIVEGKIVCMISDEELEEELRVNSTIKRAFAEILKEKDA